ncbi:MAG: tRNA (guanosine(37)-N1)-methyltransferase TrmD [Nitrospinaceae bacterium]|jgi:tRNA (guanine37-N1)-methyltransferase|nr:tRNA (guanosine(37)-N1)-methyltransferase TrmD [Nitrospinaceae bacterium]MBT3434591.1 tRNA (guanosine(37)-N1)-methyltransferase TrmD [Nitrospinaceae bacterium]MBT3821294.1 tRNA (guanosine(37)-N1)-methyltransferase TrmD [Nitrospinaceae bacterium]MBT4094658.1 tRNA (guanosine(37)-N1)-methyltransferase TrmD [Nitrospinaceae bacterium]MBT4431665.1 tRNA (guanosine(37)-N1)-methyltransferase TrmD [Nitrospinaceae bacterium]
MRFDVLTVFPDMLETVLDYGVVGRAREQGLVEFKAWDLRDFAEGSYRQVDDTPYGGGGGMVMKPEPLARAIETISADRAPRRIFMTPQGSRFDQKKAEELAEKARPLLFICGRYEGVDERIREEFIDEEISIGDYVLTGGELPALAVIDAVSRLLPGVLGNEDSAANDSFTTGLLDCPHYTRPPEFRGKRVPDVLLSGDHEKIRLWRREEALKRTQARRGDMIERAELSEADRRLLER